MYLNTFGTPMVFGITNLYSYIFFTPQSSFNF